MTHHRFSAIALLSVALLIAGCEREDPIKTYEAPKDPPPPAMTGGPGIRWTIPATWKPLRVTNTMIYASFEVAKNLKPLTVSQLPPAGGDTLANVNRWEKQLGLPPSDEASLAKVAIAIKVDGQDAQLVDLTGPATPSDGGPQQRMLAAIVPARDSVWFFKLQGPADKIPPHKDAFVGFLQTIKVAGAQTAQPPVPETARAEPRPPVAAAENQQDGKIDGIASMKLPEGWKIDPNPRPMRSATIIVPGKDGGAGPGEIVVSRLRGAFGEKLPNIIRWRGQVGLPPTDDVNAHKPEEVTLDQGPALIYDFQGPEAAGKERKRQFVFQTNFPGAQQTWFFRLIGPHESVTTAKPKFDEFVKSLKFDQ